MEWPVKSIVGAIEYFKPRNQEHDEVTLIDAYDSFTYNIVQMFLKLGAPVRVFRSKENTVDNVVDQIGKYLVLSPGPGTPSSGGIMKDLIIPLFGKIPILGICLGMQSINEVFGGVTLTNPKPMHGKFSLISHDGTGIFSGITSPIQVARYHSLFISNLSPNFSIQSTIENIIMAFHMTGQIACVQFHPESFLTPDGPKMIKNYLEKSL